MKKQSCNERVLTILELDKILDAAAKLSVSKRTGENIRSVRPISNLDDIRRSMRETEELSEAIRYDEPVPIYGFHDFSSVEKKLEVEGMVLLPPELLIIRDNLSVARLLKVYFSERTEKYPLPSDIARPISENKEIEGHIDRIVDETGTIRNNASQHLRQIRRKISLLEERLKKTIESVLAGLGNDVISDRFITKREGRYVIPVRETHRHRVPGVVHDRSSSGQTIFVEPISAIEEMNKIREAQLAEKDEIERILMEITEKCRVFSQELSKNQSVLHRIDEIWARASLCVRLDCTEPVVDRDGTLEIVNGRHPLLFLKRLGEENPEDVVPLDLRLEPEIRTLIISGPNAGGKTVALKTVGLLTLMAMTGFTVPAGEKTRLIIPEAVFANIGDQQSIEDDLSTFSSHISRLIEILYDAGPKALVLLDELGSGTNPDDGCALAVSVLEELTSRGCLTLATTHHSRLKTFAHKTPGIQNASMQFNNKKLIPTYRIIQGIPGASYAFEIARRIGMPENIVTRASEIVGDDSTRLDELILHMEDTVRSTQRDKEKAEQKASEASMLREKYERLIADVNKERRKILEKALMESDDFLKSANAQIEQAVREIRSKKADRPSILKAKETVEKAKREVAKKIEKIDACREKVSDILFEDLRKGQQIYVESMGREGIISSLDKVNKTVTVQMGKVRLSIPFTDVRLVDSQTESQKIVPKKKGYRFEHAAPKSLEINLRGMTFEEARDELDHYLDSLYLAGITRTTVIHGKGTGVLRRKITEYLNADSRVKSLRLGEHGEGGSGVTIVELN